MVYEITPDGPQQVKVQPILETKTEVTTMFLGELQVHKIKPLEETCTNCLNSQWEYFGSIKACQDSQRTQAQDRGFTILVCPDQLIKED